MALNATGDVAHPSAILDLKSNSQGLLVPRMTLLQRNAIASPANGLLIYQTDDATGFYVYNGLVWNAINSLPSGSTGDILYHNGTNWTHLPVGAEGQLLVVSGGMPTWANTAAAFFPTVTTNTTSAITGRSALGVGNVTAKGISDVTARGLCWSTTPMPTITDQHSTDGMGPGIFTSSLINLSGSTTYYVRAYATNGAGTGYGNQVSFLTGPPELPVVSTGTVTLLTDATATGNAEVTSDGGSPIIARGLCWNLSSNPTIADGHSVDGPGLGAFTSSITGLSPWSIYHIRAYATTSAGTAYGSDITLTTMMLGDSYGGGLVGYLLHAGDAGYSPTAIHGLIITPGDMGDMDQSTAWAACDALVWGGYSDWRLPSIDELQRVAPAASVLGLSYDYWSNYYDDGDGGSVFFPGGLVGSYFVGMSLKVRAVRYF